ncbi:egg cell-secreted protein 1.4-like [Vitis riparia]|uniref:egg cell-secreted protein 1.4-like n=1 Tax=Vitis riparia TaxID=96939 RepID=UPI00155B400F|nr:egg cell-secreted protein 1.4-like [Vitis riparia]
MARKNQVASAMVVSVVCMSMLLHTGLAHIAPNPPPQRPNIPGLLPPFLGIDLQKCWSSILKVEGCAWEVYKILFSFQFGSIGPACCKAISSIEDNCWPKMFPLAPLFPPLLKSMCVRPSPPPKEV